MQGSFLFFFLPEHYYLPSKNALAPEEEGKKNRTAEREARRKKESITHDLTTSGD